MPSPDTLARALSDVDVAYYFLHSMDGQGNFVERDRELAQAFGRCAADAGVAGSSTSRGCTPTTVS